MADVQVAIGLGRKAQADLGGVRLADGVMGGVAGAAAPFAGSVGALGQVFFDDLAQKIADFWGFFVGRGGHGLILGGGRWAAGWDAYVLLRTSQSIW